MKRLLFIYNAHAGKKRIASGSTTWSTCSPPPATR